MALLHCDFFSEALGVSTSICVILPQNTRAQIGMQGKSNNRKHPTLYLLHGLSDDHTIWQRRTSIERYVAPLGLAVVMPAAGRSFYTDMAHGYKYWTYISEELPEIARSFFPLSDAREDNFVAGLSMGGYGALKLGLRRPEKFAAAASLSGVTNIAETVMSDLMMKREFENIFGDLEKVRGSENDLFHLVKKAAGSDGAKPLLYQCCGTEDFLYQDNIAFRDAAKKLPISLTYEEEPGTHDWGYWDKKIQRVLEWLPLQEK